MYRRGFLVGGGTRQNIGYHVIKLRNIYGISAGCYLCWVLRTITRWTGSLDFCVRHNLVFSPTTTCPERMVQFLPHHNAGIHTSMKPKPEPCPFWGQSGRASEGKKDSRIYLGFAGLILILSYCKLINEWPLALPRARSVFSLTSKWAR